MAIGVVLIVTFWGVSWLRIRPISDYYFFPLWFGYILAVDGFVSLRTGSSPIDRDRWRVEAVFCRLKDFRRIATRYDKLARNFASALALAAIIAFWC